MAGLREVAVEVAKKKISSEEETWSDQSVLIFHNNLEVGGPARFSYQHWGRVCVCTHVVCLWGCARAHLRWRAVTEQHCLLGAQPRCPFPSSSDRWELGRSAAACSR